MKDTDMVSGYVMVIVIIMMVWCLGDVRVIVIIIWVML